MTPDKIDADQQTDLSDYRINDVPLTRELAGWLVAKIDWSLSNLRKLEESEDSSNITVESVDDATSYDPELAFLLRAGFEDFYEKQIEDESLGIESREKAATILDALEAKIDEHERIRSVRAQLQIESRKGGRTPLTTRRMRLERWRAFLEQITGPVHAPAEERVEEIA